MSADDDILSALAPLNVSQRLGRYELLIPIGRGGMAVVWAARLQGSRGFSKMVAIKVMLPHLSVDPRFERMFLKEAKIASKIRHPNVCEILDLGEQDGILYLVMDWIDGDSLATLMQANGEPLALEVAAHLMAKAARGLQAAHELTDEEGTPLGVVHRDVSPQNVLVTADGEVKIVDFGVAKAAIDGDHTTQSGFTKGKVGYIAPEQVNTALADARTDVFALGVVLYELSTRVHPFRRATELATLLAVASTNPAADPTQLVASYPDALAAIVRKATAKDPDDRYPTMAALARDLEAFVAARGGEVEIAGLTRDTLGGKLAASRMRRARRLREADLAFEERRRARAVRDDATNARHPDRHGPGRDARRTIALASVVVLALAIGTGAGARFARGRAVSSAAQASPPTSATASAGERSATTGAPIAGSATFPSATAAERESRDAAVPPGPRPAAASVRRPPSSAPLAREPTAPRAAPSPPLSVLAPSPAVSVSAGARFREPGF